MKSIKPRFQIIYSHKDKNEVVKIERLLDRYKIEYFIDEKNIEPGEIILERILEEIKNCTHLLVYLSPASVDSVWVIVEVGMALALNKRVISLVTHPALKIPSFLSNRKYMTKIKELENYLSEIRGHFLKSPISKMNSVERLAKEHLYYGSGAFASAIRLFGADDEFITRDMLHVHYHHVPFKIPHEFADEVKYYLEKKRIRS